MDAAHWPITYYSWVSIVIPNRVSHGVPATGSYTLRMAASDRPNQGKAPSTEPPEWLDCWPSVSEFRARFPARIRTYAISMAGRGKPDELRWDPSRLILQFAGQRVVWTLRNEDWSASCTCGYAKGACPHAFLAGVLFRRLAEARGWLHETTRTSRIGPLASGPVSPPVSGRRPRIQGDLWEAAATQANADGAKLRLVAEVDLHHEPGKFTLRFYEQGKERRLLGLRAVSNLARQARGPAARCMSYVDSDKQFLAWLAGRLAECPEVRRDLKVLKLDPEHFENWCEAWEETPGRFLERATQKPLAQGGRARLQFELRNRKGRTEIAAVVLSPDGERHHFHDLHRALAGNGGSLLLGARMLSFEPPVSWRLLHEVFARKSPTMDSRHVPKHLPALLEYRLDLLGGPAVRHEDRCGICRVSVVLDEGQFSVTAEAAGVPLHPGALQAAGRIRRSGDHFVVERARSDHLKPVRRLLTRLLEHGKVRESAVGLPASARNALHLVDALADLPSAVPVDAPESLQALIAGVDRVAFEIQAHVDGGFLAARVGVDAAGTSVTPRELRDAARTGGVVHTANGEWLRLGQDALETARKRLAELEGMLSARMLMPEARKVLKAAVEAPDVRPSPMSRETLQDLLETPPDTLQAPPSLAGILRSYQAVGFEFLAERVAYRVGAILADDMGLGKTLQVLAVLEAARLAAEARSETVRALVVCPASVVAVWQWEAARFCPELTCRAYRGTPDRRAAELEAGAHVLVTNYAILRNDVEVLRAIEFDFVILDEAQAIKNPDAQVTRAVKSLQAANRLVMTGTPVENRALDLWSIMDFCNPGFLGRRTEFEEATRDAEARVRLARQVRPTMLRRRKSEVCTELPPVTHEVMTVDLAPGQRELYQAAVLHAREQLRERGPVEVLAALTRLRQICCDPRLLKRHATGADDMGSAKLDVLLELLEELTEEGHSALVFSQFAKMLHLVRDALRDRGLDHFLITGETPANSRTSHIEEFQKTEDPQVFLLSLKAAGTGITLTKADYVFVYDPWWNPAAERQAIDRTHRIGQDKPVIAYRLIAADTVEERVLDLQRSKAELFDQVVEGADAAPSRLTRADLERILAE